MSSHSNRRIRAQRKRHARIVARLKDRIRTFTEQGRKSEAATVRAELLLLTGVPAHTKRVNGKDIAVRPYVPKHTYHHKIGTPLGLTPTSPVLEKQEPKVHGVNAQRETRSRPKVGGAGRKSDP